MLWSVHRDLGVIVVFVARSLTQWSTPTCQCAISTPDCATMSPTPALQDLRPLPTAEKIQHKL